MWEQVFEAQMDIWRWWQKPFATKYGEGFVEDMKRKGKIEEEHSPWDHLPEMQSTLMLMAEPIYIDKEMVEVWKAAAKDFEPEPLTADDLITTHGFIYLPEPLYMNDAHDKRLSFRAIAWGPSVWVNKEGSVEQRGIGLSLYTHIDDDDDYNESLREMTPEDHPIRRSKLTLSHVSAWGFGDDFKEIAEAQMAAPLPDLPETQDYSYAAIVKGSHDFWRNVQALWRLMQQKVTVHTEMKNPRSTRRRARREGIEDKPVTVIRLRRPKKPKDSEEDVEEVNWSHRWLVGSHWRNQWYPSLGIHRQIFIAPYIKGPEDKELRIREKRAFELVQ